MKFINLNLLLFCLFAFLSKIVFSQEINSGPRFTALGNSAVALQSVWSLQSNQAGLAGIEKPIASIAYQNNLISTELSTQSAVCAYPLKNNVFGLSLQHYGFDAYSEQRIGFAYAKRFGKSVSAAININAHQIKIAQYGSAQTYSVEVGFQYKHNPKLTLGTHIANPNKSSYNHEVNADISTLLEFGAAYQFSNKVLLSSSLIQKLNSLTDARFGLEYTIIEWLSFRGGVNLNPFKHFAGFGLKHQKFCIDAAVSAHPDLGYSPQLSLAYEF